MRAVAVMPNRSSILNAPSLSLVPNRAVSNKIQRVGALAAYAEWPLVRVAQSALVDRASLPSQSVRWRWSVGVVMAVERQAISDEIVDYCRASFSL
jgi:hypothetical protein